jgi:hypothetical protein
MVAETGIPIIAFTVKKDIQLVDYSFFFYFLNNMYIYALASTIINYAYFVSLNYKFIGFKFLYINIFQKLFCKLLNNNKLID